MGELSNGPPIPTPVPANSLNRRVESHPFEFQPTDLSFTKMSIEQILGSIGWLTVK